LIRRGRCRGQSRFFSHFDQLMGVGALSQATCRNCVLPPICRHFCALAASKFIKAFELANKLSVFGGGIPAHRLHPLLWKRLS
jgi:hypothetical protein